MLVVGVFSCITNVLMLTTPIYMLQMFDRVLSSRNFDTLVLLTVIASFALITLAALMVIRSAVLINIGFWFNQQISSAALASAISTSTSRGKAPSSRILGDLSIVQKFFSRAAIIPLFDAPWSPIFILLVFFLSPILGAVALVGLILMFGLAIGHDRIVAFLSEKAGAASRSANKQVKGLLRNADAAESMGMVASVVHAWSENNNDALELQARKQQAQATYSAITQFVTQALRVAMLCAGATLVINNSITTGVMLASAILASRALAPMTRIVKARRSVVDSHKAYQRLKNDLESVPDRGFGERMHLPRGNLCVHRASFRYSSKSSSRPVRRISLELEPGEVLCVFGPSGSGKSTFAKLIVGILKPRYGQVLLGGSHVDSLSPDTRAAHIGYMPADVQLFDGTIHENISRMRVGVEQSVVEAAKMAGIHDSIINLPQGYDTKVVNNELPLSPGEIKLISLSRALFGNPRLVVLDEPTSNLDKANEKNLVEVARALKNQGAIVVVVTHRVDLLRCADQVLVLPAGKVTRPGRLKDVNVKAPQDGRDLAVALTSGADDA